jgi:excinuclease ABC subunit C
MRDPITALPSDLDSIPDRPAVFMVWAAEGKPYLARTTLLRRRLKRLISERDRASRVLNLRGVVDRIEYWPAGSQIEATLIHLELAQRHFPDDWPRLTRLRPPVFLRLTLDNPFPRTLITTRFGKGLFYGPFPSRAAAEHFEGAMLDLFQLRRCEENLAPAPEHPGCIYGEMNRCLRPCQQAVSVDEYRGESARVEQFLRSNGASLIDSAETARDRASSDMQFEEAARLHQRVERVKEVQSLSGDLARTADQTNGIAVVPSAEPETVDLWFMLGGSWQQPRGLSVSDGAGQSMDRRLREMLASLEAAGSPNPEHLSILIRWYGSTWRDGEWIPFDSFERVPYRKLVNAIGRVHAQSRKS